MNTLKVKLKQHTPIIHFQHEQDGATIRASEVKPKLDRFIMGCILKENNMNPPFYEIDTAFSKLAYSDCKYKNWLIGKGNAKHIALDYKIKIHATKSENKFLIVARERPIPKSDPKEESLKGDFILIAPSPFFAIEEEAKEYSYDHTRVFSKMGVFSEKDIDLTINTSSSDLREIIRKSISAFFLSENFGTRQSKGFGSFTVTQIDDIPVTYSPNYLVEFDKLFDSIYLHKELIKFENGAFKKIQTHYSILKSGINYPYTKSKLFLNALKAPNGPIRWEKRKIKIEIHQKYKDLIPLKIKPKTTNSACYDETPNQSWVDPTDPPYQYGFVRALLGLSDKYEFLTEQKNKKYIAQVSSRNNLKRFRSPLLFKIIGNQIYLLANNIPKPDMEILTKENEFHFLIDPKIINEKRREGEPLEESIEFNLTVPNNISITNFLSFAMKNTTNDLCLGSFYTALKQTTTNEK